MPELTERLRSSGWQLIRCPYSEDHLAELRAATTNLSQCNVASVRHRAGAVYAARNVLNLVPEVTELWETDQLVEILTDALGPDVGLVRGLFFDKPPDQTWALPWHKDLLIAIQQGAQNVDGYSKPRLRAGVMHTEPPVEVLQRQLTLRIHFDAMTSENGPLKVLTGSHHTGKALQIKDFPNETILAEAGDVLLMSPLLVHASGCSDENCQSHRRILHLEFSGQPHLPGGVKWHQFRPIHRGR